MSAYYEGLEFRTKLDATWAAFFDLAGWDWWYNPRSFDNWKPEFKVRLYCSHSECRGEHILYVSILDINSIISVKNHPAFDHFYVVKEPNGKSVGDAGAVFGNHPSISHWEMTHGAGGGIESVEYWAPSNINNLWQQAKAKIY
jgi:hypothetical protein